MTLTTRTLDVLGAFTARHPRLRLVEIAAATGLPLTTVHRIVADLVGWGALERDEDGTISVGLRLWELASLVPRGPELRNVALPFLEDLYTATRENVQLAVREDLQSVFVERLTGPDAVDVMTRVGTRFPLPATGVGRVLLAHAPPEVQEAALAAPMRRWTDRTLVDPDRLRAVLAEVRRAGVAFSDQQVTLGAASVAAPVRRGDGEVVAAISVVYGVGRTAATALVPAVRTAALGISRALGVRSLTS
ncbi:IclR family transcriptional regulator [Kineococcus gynurae]|uniref:IclR family transcriptional regulator n=1 Tax=Kineococcus gynurae TaxID=452979 RepID=A0ABV5LWA9_9ACTN